MLKTVQKQQISDLRNKGYGYKSIASILKVKRDAVRDFCKNEGLTGYLGYGKSVILSPSVKEESYLDKCKQCGKEINKEDRIGRKSKFCSNKCRRVWWNEHPECKDKREGAWYSFICLCCGIEFKSYGNKNRKYCSRECCTEYRFGSATQEE